MDIAWLLTGTAKEWKAALLEVVSDPALCQGWELDQDEVPDTNPSDFDVEFVRTDDFGMRTHYLTVGVEHILTVVSEWKAESPWVDITVEDRVELIDRAIEGAAS